MTTTETTRQRLGEWYLAWEEGDWEGDTTPHDMLAEWINTETAAVDSDGGLYVVANGGGSWLSDDEADKFLAWLSGGPPRANQIEDRGAMERCAQEVAP